ncbi:MAG: ribonuclease M5 [Solobacterium sp.]|nr:ribonuclease M5 [Solobacterium sp.]
MKEVIKEVIVVEGAHDSARLKEFFDCETIITGGLGMRDGVLEEIQAAKDRCGVIVFTDPDGPGAKIRRWIDEAVPGCKHAYVMKEEARTTRKVGVEHASYEVLKEALDHTVEWQNDKTEESIRAADFYELGLLGTDRSEALRKKVAKAFHIGHGSAKTLRQSLNKLGITKEEVENRLNNE